MIVIFGIHSGLEYLSGIFDQVFLARDIQNKVMGTVISVVTNILVKLLEQIIRRD